MKQAISALAIAAAVLLTAGIAGCSGDPTSPATGNVQIMLTDAPIDLSTVSAVNVTLTEFILYPADDSEPGIVMELPEEGGMTLNLLDYQNGAVTLVASAEVPEGDYRRIHMGVSRAELVHDDDGDPETGEVTEEIKLPSGKVDIPVAFSITAGEGMEVTIDFDAARSVQVNGTSGDHIYILRPVVTPVGMRTL